MPLFFAATEGVHVSLPAEAFFTIFGFPVTNALLSGLLGYALLIWLFVYVAGRVKQDKKNRFVSFVQWIFEIMYGTVEKVIGDKALARKVAPFAITLFFFILVQYWVGVLPFAHVVTWNGVPILRSGVADLNMTFGLAVLTMVLVQVYAIRKHGFFGNIGRYFRNPFKDVVGAFEGILELMAEFSRFVGLSFRLFGNVFAGEMLLMMIAILTSYAAPLALPPFYAFELFIGAVQAYIFFMLTIVFISLGQAGHGEGHDAEHEAPAGKTKQLARAK